MTGAKTKARILVVDDEAPNRKLLVAMLEAEGYSAYEATGGMQAVSLVQRDAPDLVLLDIMMPGMDGYEVTKQLKADAASSAVPIILVTALTDRDSRVRGLESGAEEFVTKPVDRHELRVRVRNLLRLKEYSDALSNLNRSLEAQIRERTRQLLTSYGEAVTTLTRAASYKDEQTGEHVARISFYSVDIAQALGLDEKFCRTIRYASPMHDVGKIGIPDAILQKPSPLDPKEWEVLKTHCALGARLLRGTTSPYLMMGAEIAAGHHERWEGGGYPDGLAGEDIPLSARITNICDQYDALRSERPYKPAYTHERATEIITIGDGRTMPLHFDPLVLEAFKRSTGRFRDIFAAHADDH